MRQGRKDFWVELIGLCPDCLTRNALNYVGLPRRHRWYGFSLSSNCGGCGGTGRRSVKITNIEEILRNPTSTRLKNRLTPKQRYVLELRYGYRDNTQYTLREIGNLMGISHEAVRRIEERAKNRLAYLNRIDPDKGVDRNG